MTIKIRRIDIKNFKSFKDVSVKIKSDNIILFDGPNGFGKTSFYDAIEFLFTGELRRFNEIIDATVDRRRKIEDGSPLLYNGTSDGDLELRAQLEIDGKSIFLMRQEGREKLKKTQKISQIKLPLYSLSSFEDKHPKLIDSNDEENYLNKYFGKHYKENFEHLNYIEQQENIYLLKQKEDKRTDAISHLFNTTAFENKISTLKVADKKLGGLCDSTSLSELTEKERALAALKEILNTHIEKQQYVRVIDWKELSWDIERRDYELEDFSDWLGEEGVLEKIQNFRTNFTDYKNNLSNQQLESLLKNDKLLTNYLQYWKFLDIEPSLSKALSLHQAINSLLQNYEGGILRKLDSDNIISSQDLINLLHSTEFFDLTSYNQALDGIRETRNRSDKLSVLLAEIKSARLSLITKFEQSESHISLDKDCPLCGYSWKSVEELKGRFTTQEQQLNSLIKDSGNDLDVEIKRFEEKFLNPIRNFLKKHITDNPIDVSFVQNLQKILVNRVELEEVHKKILTVGVDTNAFTLTANHQDEEYGLISLIQRIVEKKKAVNFENLNSYFGDIFLSVFNNNIKNVDKLSINEILKKRAYLEWQLSIAHSNRISKLEIEYKNSLEIYKNSQAMRDKLKNLINIYSTSLKLYQRAFIENIEILFHIYYGRITQETKGSLGLFIKSDDERSAIRFLEDHSKDTDAVFTMSSGQLATLVIAFTLALNKRFSVNKLLFIDDPMQTLDELNIAGLVELLRNEFSDRQIFVSTHEDMMSAYIRYKFKKHSLDNERVSFKDLQLNTN